MNLTQPLILATSIALVLSGCNNATPVSDEIQSGDPLFCKASQQWVTNPSNPPAEIPGDGENLCQFYQFSWQWFINLMAAPQSTRNFLDSGQYPVFLGTEQNSCATNTVASKLFIRTQKDSHTSSSDFTLPSGTNQALNDAVIYDQQGNVVLYEARFNKDMCNVASTSTTLPAGTTEIKSSWRKISEQEKSDYVWIQSDTNANGKLESDEIYGMVGFHLVKSTALHPEFIWATFEHRSNAPDCQTKPQTSQGWSFASSQCASSLPNPKAGCDFNKTADISASTPLTGTPTEICQVYAQGTREGDNQATKNRANITTINKQLQSSFAALPNSSELQVLSQYKLVGALWVSDTSQSSSLENQRGSIQLANTTMETNAQQGFGELSYSGKSSLQPAANCFACHGYSGPQSNAQVSHIFTHIHGSGEEK